MNTEGPVSVPLLILGSRADSLFSEIPVRRTAAHYGVEAVVLDQGCHDLMLDPDWQSSADAVLRWLETICCALTYVLCPAGATAARPTASAVDGRIAAEPGRARASCKL